MGYYACMELRLLKHFIAVAEELHFARAASRLHLTQPALSKQIQQLEEELGFPLFYRTKQRVELLDAGHVLLDEARRILRQAENAVESARRTHKRPLWPTALEVKTDKTLVRGARAL